MRAIVRKFVPLRIRKAVWRMRNRPRADGESRLQPLLEVVSASVSTQPTPREMLHTARSLHKKWRLNDALEVINQLIARSPEFTPALFVKSDILIDLGAHEEAMRVTLDILERDPLSVQAINQLGSIGHKIEVSVEVVERELQSQPLSGPLYLKAVTYLNAWSYFAEAKELATEALNSLGAEIPQHITDALIAALAFAHERTGEFREAIALLRKVKGVGARKTATEAIARCEMELGRPAVGAAIIGYGVQWEGDPVCYSKTLLPIQYALGDIKNAHLSYRDRGSSLMIANTFKMPHPSTISVKSGRYKRQDAFIFTEGGPGDEIRIASLYEELDQYFRQVRITCDPRLEALLCRSFPKIEFVPVARYRAQFRSKDAGDRLNLPHKSFWTFANDRAFDLARRSGFVCASLDLLGEFRATRPDFRTNPARLKPTPPDPSVVPPSSDKQRVGLAWRSLLRSATRDVHYLDVSDLAPLATVPNTEYWLLQSAITPEEWDVLNTILPEARFVRDLDVKDDLDGLSSIISAMDVVVSPGTNIVELAGMLDVPTILLSTSHATTWRRNADGSDVWFERGKVMFADPVWDRAALMQNVAKDLVDRAPLRSRKSA